MPHPFVTFSKHAKERIRQRGVSQQQVAAVLAGPDRMYFGPKGNLVA